MVGGGRWATIRHLRSTAHRATPMRQTVLFLCSASIQRQHWFWSIQHLFPRWNSPAWHHRDHLGYILTCLSEPQKKLKEDMSHSQSNCISSPSLNLHPFQQLTWAKLGLVFTSFCLNTLSLPQMAKWKPRHYPAPQNALLVWWVHTQIH